jgi:hypothetical protein
MRLFRWVFGVGVYEYDYEHAAGGRWDSTASLCGLALWSNELSQVDRQDE